MSTEFNQIKSEEIIRVIEREREETDRERENERKRECVCERANDEVNQSKN